MTRFFVGITFAFLMFPLVASAQVDSGKRPPDRSGTPMPVRIILVGDSTMTPHTGWGGSFCARHVHELVACVNLARGGRSTRSYRAEGSWDLVLAELGVPGYAASYVLIEMGHNDKSTNPEIGTDLKTEFPASLRRFVTEVRDRGASPVLVTPLATRHFRNGLLLDTLFPWAEQVRAVATDMTAPMVDLNAASEDIYLRLGPVGAMAFSSVPPSDVERKAAEAGTTLPARVPAAVPVSDQAPADDPRRAYTQEYIHLNAHGAEVMAAAVAARLPAAVPGLRGWIVP